MGVYKYPPKHNNPNWNAFSARKKRYDDANKSKSTPVYGSQTHKEKSKVQFVKPGSDKCK